MSFFRKNLWTVYYLLLLLGVLALILFSLLFWKQIHKQFILEQESLTKVTSNSMYSIFSQYDTLLDVLGQQLVLNNTYTSLENTKSILDNLLKNNDTILGLGLANPNGILYITTSNLEGSKLKNLLSKDETRSSFLKTIGSKEMVIGRTYYHPTFQKLIVPMRKAIRNKKNEVVAVMTAGIELRKGLGFLDSQLQEYNRDIFLLREYDAYIQFEPHNHDVSTYMTKVDTSFLKHSFGKIDYEEFKQEEKVYSFKAKALFGNETMLYSVKYIAKYDMWSVSLAPYSLLFKQYLKIELFAVLIFIATSGLFFILFRSIYKHEKRQKEKLFHQANYDELTDLYNRTYLASLEKKLTAVGSKPFSLLFIDIDNFKNVNDNYGHKYGDMVLVEASNRLRMLSNKEDVIIRHSGDEFLFISNITDNEKLGHLSRKIIEILSQPYFIEQYNFILGASIGVSKYPDDGKSVEEIKRYADFAMYEAKNEKNHFCIFEDRIKNDYVKRFKTEQEMKLGLIKKEFYMNYQPQVNAQGEIYGVEALVRWHNKKLGFIAPNEFIEIAESIGFMKNLGEFILQTTLMEMSELQKATQKHFKVSINISVKQFMEKDFYSTVIGMIKKFNIPYELVTLEITENMFIEDIRYISRLLRKFKKHNISISLDDFGTGYSSLNILKKLPIDELKIDKSFVDDILKTQEDLHMVEGIVSIAQKLNLDIVAEGIETKDQLECLEHMGCKTYQGYFFAKPMSKLDLLHFLE